MQNRALSDAYRIEYAPFEDIFRRRPRFIHWGPHQPLPGAIQGLHHHDALEVGYCREGAGIFIIDGEVLPFSAPCATVLYPGQLHKACSMGGASQPLAVHHLSSRRDIWRRCGFAGPVALERPARPHLPVNG